MTQQKKKTIADRLTPRQKHAIARAQCGTDSWLYEVLLETHRAKLKVAAITLCGAEEWKRCTLKHYENLYDYLYGFLTSEQSQQELEADIERCTKRFDDENASL